MMCMTGLFSLAALLQRKPPTPVRAAFLSLFFLSSLSVTFCVLTLRSWTPTRMTATLAGLIARLYSPPAVIELLITLSVHMSFHRWTSVYVPRG